MKSFARMGLIGLATMMASSAWAAPVGIAAGAPTGTNYPMAADIASMCSTPQSPINVVTTEGGLDNVFKVYGDKSSQYGIVPVDTLFYQQGQNKRMMENIKMVFPFFSVEVHLIAKDGSPINSLADLAGKRVIEGPEGSGTWVTVQVIKALTGIKWQGFYASQQDGFNSVMAGQADAEFIVAGKPIKMLTKASGFKLVPVKHPQLSSFKLYRQTLIDSGSYPTQRSSVQTIQVDNVLVTYAFKNQYQQEIGDLVGCITRNIDKLQTGKNYHAKWKDVDPLDIDRIDWPAHPAAVKAIKREAKK